MVMKISLLYLFVSFVGIVSAIDIYPWNKRGFEARNEEILDYLRDDLDLELKGKDILTSLKESPTKELFIKNYEGEIFSIKQKETISIQKTPELYDTKELEKKLHGLCEMLTIDYWTFEWCHRKEMSQFHFERQGNKIVKTPEWSLGKYSKTNVYREYGGSQNMSSPIIKIVDTYIDGQICHENNHKRSTVVNIQCCEDIQLPDASTQARRKAFELPYAMLNKVHETTLCHYEATVCTPLLCQIKKPIQTKSQEFDLLAVVKLFQSRCVTKLEDWWTYEVCFDKGIRQIHFDFAQNVSPEGIISQKQVLASQFHLGLPIPNMFEDPVAVKQSVKPSLSKEIENASIEVNEILSRSGFVSPIFNSIQKRGSDYFSFEYINGTQCDLDHANRSTIVEVSCGARDELVSIREISTCKYQIKITLVVVCQIPGFKPEEEPKSQLEIKPVGELYLDENSKNSKVKIPFEHFQFLELTNENESDQENNNDSNNKEYEVTNDGEFNDMNTNSNQQQEKRTLTVE